MTTTAVAPKPATKKQISYVGMLSNERQGGAVYVQTQVDAYKRSSVADLSSREISNVIGVLLGLPRNTKKSAPKPSVEAGIYIVGGDVVKVQKAVHGSGNLYAKRLVLTLGDGGTFEYEPGLIKKVKPEDKMSLEQAKDYGHIYGVCCNCGRTLTDENSIAAGIGPVCAEKF